MKAIRKDGDQAVPGKLDFAWQETLDLRAFSSEPAAAKSVEEPLYVICAPTDRDPSSG